MSVFRRTITKALTGQIREEYKFHPNQWGFLKQTDTDVAIASAINSIRKGRNNIALLDLSKAYDTVPRHKLAELCSYRHTANVTEQILALLVPVALKTQGQTFTMSTKAVVGVPQEDPISPLLFNLYMDPLLERLDLITGGEGNGFADDIMLMGKDEKTLQDLLDQATRWARLAGMSWNPNKSELLGVRHRLRLAGGRLETTKRAVYSGVAIDTKGVQEQEILRRIDNAM